MGVADGRCCNAFAISTKPPIPYICIWLILIRFLNVRSATLTLTSLLDFTSRLLNFISRTDRADTIDLCINQSRRHATKAFD